MVVDDSTRRSLLKATTGLIGTGLIAGCTGSGDGGSDGTDSTPAGTSPSDASSGSAYPEQDIDWIVPYGPGAAFDLYSRGMAGALEAHLPDDVNVTIRNEPGSGGRRGMNAVYRAEPDGYTIGTFNIPGIIPEHVQGNLNFDPTAVSWLGRIGRLTFVVCVRGDSEFTSLADMQAADEVTFAEISNATTGYFVVAFAAEEMGLPIEIVTGFDGRPGTITALLRGDVDAVIVSAETVETYIEEDDLRPLFVLDHEPYPVIPDVPTVAELDYPELADLGLHFVAGAPPDTDEASLSILRESFVEAGQSDELRQWSEEANRPINVLDSSETEALVQDTIELVESRQDILQEYF